MDRSSADTNPSICSSESEETTDTAFFSISSHTHRRITSWPFCESPPSDKEVHFPETEKGEPQAITTVARCSMQFSTSPSADPPAQTPSGETVRTDPPTSGLDSFCTPSSRSDFPNEEKRTKLLAERQRSHQPTNKSPSNKHRSRQHTTILSFRHQPPITVECESKPKRLETRRRCPTSAFDAFREQLGDTLGDFATERELVEGISALVRVGFDSDTSLVRLFAHTCHNLLLSDVIKT
ncbi:hypothetical protein BLNAU_21206 [Blattamonas nauphoetae]|uniref:Uncharacterized protein n=1 Tax=Blattamonas nauphoetae TaxID=2049346 RepID=A0ABQ9WWI7_9EUKA|nr:hypothetical protein BLNAU_21206 [Blattamonas nauphoetae]